MDFVPGSRHVRAMRLAIVALAAGCTGPARLATVTTTGTIGGKWPNLQAAASQIETGPKGSMLIVELSPRVDVCDALAASAAEAGAVTVELAFAKASTTKLFEAGTDLVTYTSDAASAGPWVEISVLVRDASCLPTPYEGQATGTATLTAADATGYAGTFDFKISDGERLTGSFSSENCTWVSARTCQ